MKNKEYVFDVIVIVGMTLFLIVLNEMGWLIEYAHYAMLPFLTIYYVGKYVGKKFAKKRSDQ